MLSTTQKKTKQIEIAQLQTCCLGRSAEKSLVGHQPSATSVSHEASKLVPKRCQGGVHNGPVCQVIVEEARKGPQREAHRGLASATYTRDHKPFIWVLGLQRGLSPRHHVLDDGHRDPSRLGGVGVDLSGRARSKQDTLVHRDDPVTGVIVPRDGKQVEGVVVIGAVDGQERGNKGARSGIPHGQALCRSEGVGYGGIIIIVTILGYVSET